MYEASYYMKEALLEAKKAFLLGEIPVGAVLVDSNNGKIVERAHNDSGNYLSIGHAELILILKSIKKRNFNSKSDNISKVNSKYLYSYDMYVTLEPCLMCLGAISISRIKRLYYGASDSKYGSIENGSKINFQNNFTNKPEIYEGILEKECSQIIKDYFKSKR